MTRPMMRVEMRRLLVATSIAALAACGRDGPAPQAATGLAPRWAAAAPAAGRPATALTGTTAAAHDQYAAQGMACQSCHPCGAKASGHDAAWMDQSSAGFHAFSADAGIASCQPCHGPQLDGVGGTVSVSCAQCHGAGWKTNCVMCHGGTDGQTGAPPRTTWGRGADPVRVGAHTSHVGATHALATAIGCEVCHPRPADALSPGHVDGETATVAFAGLASRLVATAPVWDRAAATCTSTYCHGATLGGGSNTAPTWTTVDGTQAACGTCHGVTMAAGTPAAALPDPNHPARPDLDCAACHPGYSAASRTTVPGTHVDGQVQVTLTCSSCHGDVTRAATALNPKLAAAPPAGTHGETATTARAVGAHLQHLQGGVLSNGVACTECHVLPPDASPAHQNGTVSVAFGTLARTGGSSPVWSRSTNTCSASWCHGAKLTGGTDTTPIWTKVDGTQDACGTCHGRPPTSGRHGQSEHRVSCGYCHGGAYTTTVADKGLHFSGAVEVAGPRIRSYDPKTHTCWPTCHGQETWQ